MYNMRIILVFISCLVISSFFSCANEAVSEKPLVLSDVLPGEWHLVEAKRNSKPTTTLQGVFFNFDTTGMLNTNFMGAELNTPFINDAGGFSFSFEDKEMKYQAEIVDKDTLSVKTKIRIFDFDIVLARGAKK